MVSDTSAKRSFHIVIVFELDYSFFFLYIWWSFKFYSMAYEYLRLIALITLVTILQLHFQHVWLCNISISNCQCILKFLLYFFLGTILSICDLTRYVHNKHFEQGILLFHNSRSCFPFPSMICFCFMVMLWCCGTQCF